MALLVSEEIINQYVIAALQLIDKYVTPTANASTLTSTHNNATLTKAYPVISLKFNSILKEK